MSKPPAKDLDLPTLSWGTVEFWLKSVDMILAARKLSSDSKYDCVMKYLEKHQPDMFDVLPGLDRSNLLPQCLDLDGKDKYLVLRNHILKCPDYPFRDEEEDEETSRGIGSISLFSCRELKPSAFLDILGFVGFQEIIFKSMRRTFWLARLPRKIQKVMFASILIDPQPLEDRTLEDLAAVADGIAAYEKYHSYPIANKLEINLPEYLEHDPEVWFYSLDEAFIANGVTDEELKCQLTLDRLPDDQLVTAALFLTDLPNQPKKYTNLKERVIRTFSLIQDDNLYSFVFRNMNRLKPKALLSFLNGAAAKSGRIVPQLLIRTFWIMLLPVRTQAVLFKLWTSSREPLQDLDMDIMTSVAEKVAGIQLRFKNSEGYVPAPELDSREIDEPAFLTELQSATSMQQKIAVGMQYCDFMYRTYYKNNPSESIKECTVWHHTHDTTGLLPRDYFFEGCMCMFHARYGEFSEVCFYSDVCWK